MKICVYYEDSSIPKTSSFILYIKSKSGLK